MGRAQGVRHDPDTSLQSASERVELLDPDRQLLPPPPESRHSPISPSSSHRSDIAAGMLRHRSSGSPR